MDSEKPAILTRRKVIQGFGGLMVAALVQPEKATVAAQNENVPSLPIASETVSPVMAKLSSYMSEARNRSLPEAVLEQVKQHVLDTLAAMISGSQLPGGHAALQFARAYGGNRVSTVLSSTILCGPIEAAIANAEFAHSDETDDYFHVGGAHPGCSIVPATLAFGEQFGVSGAHFLRAVALGYDIGMRFTIAAVAGTSLKDTHTIVGNFGAAASCACIASLTAEQMRWVLDYAAQQAGSGIPAWQRDTQHIEKGFVFAVMGARNGLMAALLVHSGWNGVDDILSGPGNFLHAYAPKADPSSLVDGLGERYAVGQTNIKKWSVGGPLQLPLDALHTLIEQRAFSPNQVKQVIVRLAPGEATGIASTNEMPDLSLRYMIAVMLIDRTVSFRAAHDKARMRDPAVLREIAKVQMVPDQSLEFAQVKPGVAPRRVAIMEVTLDDGTKLSQRAEHERGTIDNPMTREEVIAKARDLIEPVLGAANCTKLVNRVFALETVEDIRELRPLLQRV